MHGSQSQINTTIKQIHAVQVILFIKLLTLNKNSKENHPKTQGIDDKALHSPFAKPDWYHVTWGVTKS